MTTLAILCLAPVLCVIVVLVIVRWYERQPAPGNVIDDSENRWS